MVLHGDPHDALVQICYRHTIGCTELQFTGHEREVMQVAGAENDGIHVGSRTVFEGASILLDLL